MTPSIVPPLDHAANEALSLWMAKEVARAEVDDVQRRVNAARQELSRALLDLRQKEAAFDRARSAWLNVMEATDDAR